MSQPKVLIVEDQTVFREMLAELLRLESFNIVGEFECGAPATKAFDSLKPDMAIVDLLLPDVSGLDVIGHVLRREPQPRVVVVTGQEKPDVVVEAFRLGAHGIITKGASLADLKDGIRRVALGGTYYCPTTSALLREHANQPERDALTAREREVLRLVALGRTSKEIASQLHISAKTVANHRHRIASKLGFSDVAGLTRYAIERGWVRDHA